MAPEARSRGVGDARGEEEGDQSELPVLETLRELVRLLEKDADLYVRYSRGPDADQSTTSRDYESGLELPGLWVDPLSPEPWWTRSNTDWVARQALPIRAPPRGVLRARCAWVLRGELVARGPDCEPLLHPVEPVALLHDSVLQEAKRHYHERFEVGRDST